MFERLELELEGVGRVRAFLTRPAEAGGRYPAILYGHSHGGRHEIGASELMDGRSYLLSPFGPLLARAGYVTLCMDMPTFGDRDDVEESAAATAHIWYGRSLIGQMVSEQAAALTYLLSRDDVDPAAHRGVRDLAGLHARLLARGPRPQDHRRRAPLLLRRLRDPRRARRPRQPRHLPARPGAPAAHVDRGDRRPDRASPAAHLPGRGRRAHPAPEHRAGAGRHAADVRGGRGRGCPRGVRAARRRPSGDARDAPSGHGVLRA